MQTVLNILTVIAFCLSTFTFVKDLVEKRKNLDAKILQIAPGYNTNYQSYYFCFQILNKSKLPISISNIQIKVNDRFFDVLDRPVNIFEAKVRDKEDNIIDTMKIPTTTMPIMLQSLGSARLYFTSYKEKDFYLNPKQKITLSIYTNRGTISKAIILPTFCDLIDFYPPTLPEKQ